MRKKIVVVVVLLCAGAAGGIGVAAWRLAYPTPIVSPATQVNVPVQEQAASPLGSPAQDHVVPMSSTSLDPRIPAPMGAPPRPQEPAEQAFRSMLQQTFQRALAEDPIFKQRILDAAGRHADPDPETKAEVEKTKEAMAPLLERAMAGVITDTMKKFTITSQEESQPR